MEVYIKAMEMPTSCDNCLALDDYGDYPRCRITEEQRGYDFPIRQKRMNKCPLVSVPPHGRLIDADALMELYADTDDLQLENMKVPIAVIRQNIMDAPTIIEAKEENLYPICEDCIFVDEPLDKHPCQECNRAFLAQRIKPNFTSKSKP